MKKTKLYISTIIIFIMLVISSHVFAVDYWDNKENKRREELFKETLASYLEQYRQEETPEEKKIISYEMIGYGLSKEETDDILAVNISFIVEPYSKENTIWSNSKNMINNGSYICFAKYKKVNGDYELERISDVPENYDEFLEEFEKYKANLPEETSNKTIQGKETDNSLANQEIEKISNIVFIASGTILALTVFIITLTVIKKLKHKK